MQGGGRTKKTNAHASMAVPASRHNAARSAISHPMVNANEVKELRGMGFL